MNPFYKVVSCGMTRIGKPHKNREETGEIFSNKKYSVWTNSLEGICVLMEKGKNSE